MLSVSITASIYITILYIHKAFCALEDFLLCLFFDLPICKRFFLQTWIDFVFSAYKTLKLQVAGYRLQVMSFFNLIFQVY